MKSMSPCNVIQERIVAGEQLDEGCQAHVVTCTRCSSTAAECLALDQAMIEGFDAVVIPDGFADEVMARLDEPPALSPALSSAIDRLLGRRWVQIALAHVGLAMATVNLLRFVLSSLLPTTSLGGLP
jgi:hypothetical protein